MKMGMRTPIGGILWHIGWDRLFVNTLSREKGIKDRQQTEREREMRDRMNEGDKIKLLQYPVDAAAVNVRSGIEG